MKKALKILLQALLSFIMFIALYIAAALCIATITIPAEPALSPDVTIYILTNGDHTDIAMPVKTQQTDWSKEIKYSNTISKDTTAALVAFGWGDKGFFLKTPTWAQLKFSVAFKAAFGLSTSALHATFYRQLQENADCRKITITKEQYNRLVTYIRQSFKNGADGHVINIPTSANYGSTDAFYQSKGRYSLFYTCNTWANNALKACGQKTCLWTPFDFQIFRKY